MKNKFDVIDKVIYVFLIVILIGIPFFKMLSYVDLLLKFNSILVIRSRVYFLWINIIFLLILYLYSIITNSRKVNYVDYLFYILGILGVISTIFAIDLYKSIFGEQNRYEGLLTLFSYYLICLNAKNLQSNYLKKKVINIFIFIGVIQSIYGILQSLTNLEFVRRFPNIPYMAFGLCSNPNFFGSYLVMLLSISSVYYMHKTSIINILLVILFSFVLYLAGSSGPLLAFCITFLFIIIFYKKKFIKYLSLGLIIFLSFYISDRILIYVQNDTYNLEVESKYYIKGDLVDNFEKLTSQDKNEIKKIGSSRINLWIRTLPVVKRYWLTGAGLDNFKDVYPQYGKVFFDKAHNVYLQIAVTNGIPALIVYMSICFITFIKSFELKDKLHLALFISFVGYCIQAFANISVIDVAPFFFMILGFLISQIDDKKRKINYELSKI